MKKVRVLTGGMLIMLSMLLFSFGMQQNPWDIPAEYMSKTSTVDASDASILKLGKMTYSKHCKSCHGNFGQGDGPKARSIDADLGDFTSAEFKAEKDGVIYYQSFVGRDEMPNFEKKITDEEERWALVAYLRTHEK